MKNKQTKLKQFLLCLVHMAAVVSIVTVSQSANAQYSESYFTGTNAEAGRIWVWPNNPQNKFRFTRLKLKVTGYDSQKNVQTTEVWDESLNNVLSVTWKLNFDSTRFKNGSTVTIESRVRDNYGNEYPDKTTGTIKNRAIVLAHRDNLTFVDPIYAERIVRTMQKMGFSVFPMFATPNGFPPNGTQNKEYVLSQLPSHNIMHIGSHGNPTSFEAPGYGGHTNPSGGTGWITPTLIQDTIAKKTKYQPPYNFVLFTSCNAMGTLGKETSFLANAFGIEKGQKNRVSVGFADLMYMFHEWTDRVYDNLNEGFTVDDALMLADSQGPPQGIPYAPTEPLNYIDVHFKRFNARRKVIGDGKSKLHTLYQVQRGKVDWAHVETIKE
jgi:hypothetical protein